MNTRIRYARTDGLNAHVRTEGDGYLITLSDRFEPAIKALLSDVLQHSDVVPWLPLESEERIKGADLLSRLCMDFVLGHERGHILGGHVDKSDEDGHSPDGLSEFSLVTRDDESDDVFDERAHAWEFEADAIGASLLDRPIDALIEHVHSQDVGSDDRTFLGELGMAVEHIGALSIAALYALFRMLRHRNELLQMVGHHPDPLVRAFTCRDVIVHRLARRQDCDQARLLKTMLYHLETFDWAMEELEFPASQMAEDAGVDQVNDALDALIALQTKYRDETRHTRQIEWAMSRIAQK